MLPEQSKSHKLVQALVVAEDQLFAVVQGHTPGEKVDRAIAENLRIEVYLLAQKMRHYYFPDEEPTWDYDCNNTYVESAHNSRNGFNLCHSDGAVIASFDLRGLSQGYEVENVRFHLPFPNMHPRIVALLVHQHVKDVIAPPIE